MWSHLSIYIGCWVILLYGTTEKNDYERERAEIMRWSDYAVINKKHNFHHKKYDIDSAIYFLFYWYYLYEKSFSSLKAKKEIAGFKTI